MTERYAGLVITFKNDVREDDLEDWIKVFSMIKGVHGVEPILASPELHVAEARADARWRDEVWKLYQKGPEGALDR